MSLPAAQPSGRSDVEPFHVMEVLAAAAERQRTHGDVISLCAGQPSTGAPRAAREAAVAAIEADALGYTETVGIRPLREAIAAYHRDLGVDDGLLLHLALGVVGVGLGGARQFADLALLGRQVSVRRAHSARREFGLFRRSRRKLLGVLLGHRPCFLHMRGTTFKWCATQARRP